MFPTGGQESLQGVLHALQLRQWFHYVPKGPQDTDCLDLSRFYSANSSAETNGPSSFPRFASLHACKQDDLFWQRQELPIALLGPGSPLDEHASSVRCVSMSYLSGVTMAKLLDMYERLKPSARTMCILVPPMTPVHMYWDFDASVQASGRDSGIKIQLAQRVLGQEESVKREFIETMSEFFHARMGRAPDWSGLHWETASDAAKGKLSLHAHLTTEAFASVDHHKRFMEAYIQFLGTREGVHWLHLQQTAVAGESKGATGTTGTSLVDGSVYTANRVFRLAGCCKPGKAPLRVSHRAPDGAELSWHEYVFRGMPTLAIDLAPGKELLCFGESTAEERAKRIVPLPPLLLSVSLSIQMLMEYTYGSHVSSRALSALHAWLGTTGYLHRGKQEPCKAASYSHTLFYGGSLAVPVTSASMLALHRAVAADFANKHLDAISEVVAAPVFRAFFELDPPDALKWTRDDVLSIAQCAQWAAAQLGCAGHHGCELWVSMKNRGGSGIHMVFPYLGINLERMLVLRRVFLSRLRVAGTLAEPVLDAHDDTSLHTNWSSIVDEQVTNTAGHVHLRKNLSAKLHPCPDCVAANKSDSASTCRLRGTICFKKRRFEPSYYQLSFVLSGEQQGVVHHALTHAATKSLVLQLQRTSIISVSQQLHPEWAVSESLVELQQQQRQVHKKRKGIALSIEQDPKRYKSVGELMMLTAIEPMKALEEKEEEEDALLQDLPLTHPASTTLLKLIRSTHARWALVELSKVTLQIPHRNAASKRTPQYFVDVRGPGAHTCLNRSSSERRSVTADKDSEVIVGEHRSASVWFRVTTTAVWQRCRGSAGKLDNRIHGQPCRKFAHKLCTVPLAISAALFPQVC